MKKQPDTQSIGMSITPDNPETSRQPYHPPKLLHYGDVASIVATNKGDGADGGVVFDDNTLS